MTTNINTEVRSDIHQFMATLKIDTPRDVNGECECGTNWPEDCECNHMELTIATMDGTQWNFQTGDNSYTGGCYSLPHWVVVSIGHDSDRAEIADDIINQLEELLHNAI
jgi:hypothetical protein